MRKNNEYRADIDGLRAVAVLAVIANHLPGEYLASGFLGVDVFFVISGYVVTASTLRTTQASFAGFYSAFLARRIRRLWPALICCVLITSLVVLAVDTAAEYSITTGIASLFGVANVFLFQTELDYFAPSSKLNAFTHTWSLGVEEQFYLLFPLLIWFAVYRVGRKLDRSLATLLVCLSLVSCGLFVFYYSRDLNLAYYLMPFRFWELGLGCLAFLFTKNRPDFSRSPIASILSPLAFCVIVGSFFLPQSIAIQSTLLAVVATAILLVAQHRSVTHSFLTLNPVVYLGRISYSLYLWHWPVVSLSTLALPHEWRSSPLLIVVMIVCASASYHFVETPFRNRRWSTHHVRHIVMGLGSSCVIGAAVYCGLYFLQANKQSGDEDSVFPASHLPLYASDLSFKTCLVDDKRPLTEDTFKQCTVHPGPGSGMPRLWALGDSHVVHLQALLYGLHEQLGLGVFFVGTPGRPYPSLPHAQYAPQDKISDYVLSQLAPGDILLISRLAFQRNHWPPRVLRGYGKWAEKVGVLAQNLSENGVHVVVVAPVPIFDFEDVRQCSLRVRQHCAVWRDDIAGAVATAQHLLYSNANHYRVFEPFSIMCPEKESYCFPDDGSKFLFRDADHLNVAGATTLIAPFIDFLVASNIVVAGSD